MNHTIDATYKIRIGNIDQWISVRTRNSAAPVLLFLHGGPGTAQLSFCRKLQREMENDFVLVNWDQRGAGKSYSRRVPKESMKIDVFIHDTIELVHYLQEKFQAPKIFLCGHSWGSYPGIKTAQKIPQAIHAYIGIGQVINNQRGETVSYEFTLSEAVHRKNQKAIRQLKEIGPPPYSDLAKSGIQRQWLYKFNGATVKKDILRYIVQNISLRDINLVDIIKFIQGTIFSLKAMDQEISQIDLFQEDTAFAVPLYFCGGKFDFNVPTMLVEEYLNSITAPKKELLLFDQSGHLPNFEEPEKFAAVCRGIRDAHWTAAT